MSDLDSLFDDMAGAKGSSSGTFFINGNYTAALKSVEWIPNGFKGTSCKFHFTVETSNNDEVKPESTRVWICKFKKSKAQDERTMADIKNLIFSLMGQDPNPLKNPDKNQKAHEQATNIFKAAISTEFAEKMKIPQNFLVGRRTLLEAQTVATAAKEGKPAGEYTRHVWSPVPKETVSTTVAS